MVLQIVSLIAAMITAASAGVGAWLARGSTAVPAALWAVLAAVALAVEMAWRIASGGDPQAFLPLRLVVLAVAVCPMMSLLGAKRPQHGVWQFIVATLACVLALPAVSATLVRPGTPPDVHAIERWFMPLLVVFGWMNFAATRHGWAALFVACGQLQLLRPFLPALPWATAEAAGDTSGSDYLGAVLIALGAVVAAVQSIVWPVTRESGTGRPGPAAVVAAIGRPFLAIRETFGAAWTLRIAERFNAIATTRGWPCRLRFDGLDVGGDPADESWHRDAIRGGRALLQRFVSEEWLKRHEGRVIES